MQDAGLPETRTITLLYTPNDSHRTATLSLLVLGKICKA